MTGVEIVGALLREDEAVTGKVPAIRIKAGGLPDGVELPALLVRQVSGVERLTLKRGPVVRNVERVAVTVRAANYQDQIDVIALVKDCCAGKTGNIAGATAVAINNAGTGPDVRGPAMSFEQTIDFRIGFDA